MTSIPSIYLSRPHLQSLKAQVDAVDAVVLEGNAKKEKFPPPSFFLILVNDRDEEDKTNDYYYPSQCQCRSLTGWAVQ